MSKNYYDILGVKKDATPEEIKKAYRKMAIEHHPDKGGDADKFKEAAEAYETLSDSNKRQEYDMYGSNPNQRFQGHGFNMEDIFSQFGDIFGSGFKQHYQNIPKRGRDLRVQVQVTLSEAIFGTTKKIRYNRNDKCTHCAGKGGTNTKKCVDCDGSGQRTISQNTPFGRVQQTTPCNSCSGSGQTILNKCSHCGGNGVINKEEVVDVNIPAGIGGGMNLNMQGYGHHILNGSPGSLQVLIEEIPHHKFTRQGCDLYCEEWVSIPDAVLGTTIHIETPHGIRSFNIDPGTESGKVLSSTGMGVPKLSTNGQTYGIGDMYIKVNIRIPKILTPEQKEIFESLKTNI